MEAVVSYGIDETKGVEEDVEDYNNDVNLATRRRRKRSSYDVAMIHQFRFNHLTTKWFDEFRPFPQMQFSDNNVGDGGQTYALKQTVDVFNRELPVGRRNTVLATVTANTAQNAAFREELFRVKPNFVELLGLECESMFTAPKDHFQSEIVGMEFMVSMMNFMYTLLRCAAAATSAHDSSHQQYLRLQTHCFLWTGPSVLTVAALDSCSAVAFELVDLLTKDNTLATRTTLAWPTLADDFASFMFATTSQPNFRPCPKMLSCLTRFKVRTNHALRDSMLPFLDLPIEKHEAEMFKALEIIACASPSFESLDKVRLLVKAAGFFPERLARILGKVASMFENAGHDEYARLHCWELFTSEIRGMITALENPFVLCGALRVLNALPPSRLQQHLFGDRALLLILRDLVQGKLLFSTPQIQIEASVTVARACEYSYFVDYLDSAMNNAVNIFMNIDTTSTNEMLGQAIVVIGTLITSGKHARFMNDDRASQTVVHRLMKLALWYNSSDFLDIRMASLQQLQAMLSSKHQSKSQAIVMNELTRLHPVKLSDGTTKEMSASNILTRLVSNAAYDERLKKALYAFVCAAEFTHFSLTSSAAHAPAQLPCPPPSTGRP